MPIKDIDANEKMCVIDSDGKLFELANGKKEIAMSVKVKSVTTRGGAYYIIDEFGKLWTYGNGADGQLGHGNTDRKAAPTVVDKLIHVNLKRISVNNNCVVGTTLCGRAFAWGKCGYVGLRNSEALPVELTWDHKN